MRRTLGSLVCLLAAALPVRCRAAQGGFSLDVTPRDVDVPLSPRPEEPILSEEALEGAVQDPAIVCVASEKNPGRWAEKYWKVSFTLLDP